ncbi:hypothetical protein [Nitrospirillum pindoramense]|uniref:hypothetical protein n=1 Tax=Nitrospirillum amazonense TaxID=28077 RepID=UPI00119DD379|nr:hypothetical protein [Nitrospirillum amazonense]
MHVAPDDPSIIAEMEEKGSAQVRLLMQSGAWSPHLNAIAVKWLREKDIETQRISELSQAEQISIAREAKDAAVAASVAAERAAMAAERQAIAAEGANRRATIALVIAALSIATAVVSIAIPYLTAVGSHP